MGLMARPGTACRSPGEGPNSEGWSVFRQVRVDLSESPVQDAGCVRRGNVSTTKPRAGGDPTGRKSMWHVWRARATTPRIDGVRRTSGGGTTCGRRRRPVPWTPPSNTPLVAARGCSDHHVLVIDRMVRQTLPAAQATTAGECGIIAGGSRRRETADAVANLAQHAQVPLRQPDPGRSRRAGNASGVRRRAPRIASARRWRESGCGPPRASSSPCRMPLVRAERRRLALAVRGHAAAGGRHQDVGDAEVALQRPLPRPRRSDVLETDRGLVDVMMPRRMRRLRSVRTYHVVS